jgi:hypothetical protein
MCLAQNNFRASDFTDGRAVPGPVPAIFGPNGPRIQLASGNI